MTYSNDYFRTGGSFRSSRDDVADMLRRYPSINRAEVQTVASALKNGRDWDFRSIVHDEHLRKKLVRFVRDHETKLDVKWREVAAVPILLGGMLSLIWLVGYLAG